MTSTYTTSHSIDLYTNGAYTSGTGAMFRGYLAENLRYIIIGGVDNIIDFQSIRVNAAIIDPAELYYEETHGLRNTLNWEWPCNLTKMLKRFNLYRRNSMAAGIGF
jgi:hypothetical protein